MITLRATVTVDYLGPDVREDLSNRLLWIIDQAVRNGSLTDGLPESTVEEIWADVCKPAEHAYDKDARVGELHLSLRMPENADPSEIPW
jgi:hypothetical protein